MAMKAYTRIGAALLLLSFGLAWALARYVAAPPLSGEAHQLAPDWPKLPGVYRRSVDWNARAKVHQNEQRPLIIVYHVRGASIVRGTSRIDMEALECRSPSTPMLAFA